MRSVTYIAPIDLHVKVRILQGWFETRGPVILHHVLAQSVKWISLAAGLVSSLRDDDYLVYGSHIADSIGL